MVPVRELIITLARSRPVLDFHVLDDGQVADALRGIARSADANGGGIQSLGRACSHQTVDFIDHGARGSEIRLIEVKHEAVTTGKGAGCGLLHGRAIGDAPCAGHVDGDFRAIVALHAKTTDDQIALCHGVDIAIGALHGGKEQRATAQALGVAQRRHGYVNALTRLGKGGSSAVTDTAATFFSLGSTPGGKVMPNSAIMLRKV